jgi:hypothetical protein
VEELPRSAQQRTKRGESATEDKVLKRLERASREDAQRVRSGGGGYH